ncbi:MAG: glycogen/starch synthase, partial [Gammaproteobacteria bacterium]|nr:glycogen/starch synthase [Gammaproteobacteria bacterium]
MQQNPELSLAAKEKLRICLTSAELAPLAKTGGLADVAAALSAYLHRAGHEVVVLMPRYSRVDSLAQNIEPVAELQDLSMRIGPW